MHFAASLLLAAIVSCSSPPGPPSIPAAASPSTRVIAVEVSRESAMYKRVKVEIHNTQRCGIVGYTMAWPKGRKSIVVDPPISAGANVDRWLRVEPDAGDLDALDVEHSRIELVTDCAEADHCRASQWPDVTGKTLDESKALLGPPTTADDSSAEWYRDSPRHVNPSLQVTLEHGRITGMHCTLR